MIGETYHGVVLGLLNRIDRTQGPPLRAAAKIVKEAVDGGGVVHAFSTGHSHMLVEEMFYRAGGLAAVNPILDAGTMLHHGASRSTRFERLPGYASAVLNDIRTLPGEPMVISSVSGVNVAPVEMALLARERGLRVIAITSCAISMRLAPKLGSGQRLMDVAEVVLDNCIEESDAAVDVPGSPQQVGALSTVAGAYLVQRLVLAVVEEYLAANETPPVFASANLPGGDDWNQRLIDRYRNRIPLL